MEHIRTEIDIAASPAVVWRVLAAFPTYPAWNPFVRSIRGDQAPGSMLHVTVQPDGGKPMSLKPRLLVYERGKELRWKGRLLAPGVFDGEHYFLLSEPSRGQVRFIHGEVFSGLLVPLVFRGDLRAGTERGFAAMNRALKALAEA